MNGTGNPLNRHTNSSTCRDGDNRHETENHNFVRKQSNYFVVTVTNIRPRFPKSIVVDVNAFQLTLMSLK